jgi:hypothetical protein
MGVFTMLAWQGWIKLVLWIAEYATTFHQEAGSLFYAHLSHTEKKKKGS